MILGLIVGIFILLFIAVMIIFEVIEKYMNTLSDEDENENQK